MDFDDALRDKISAAIAVGDFDGALRSLLPPPAPVRKSLFELDEPDDGLLDVDLAVAGALVDAKMLWLGAELQVEVGRAVARTVARLRGRADEYD